MSDPYKHSRLELLCRIIYFRRPTYTILVFNLNMERICLYLITHLPNQLQLVKETGLFLQYYNNNYRPIYHLEKYIYSLMSIVHKIKV
jgi:hypothetical protein